MQQREIRNNHLRSLLEKPSLTRLEIHEGLVLVNTDELKLLPAEKELLLKMEHKMLSLFFSLGFSTKETLLFIQAEAKFRELAKRILSQQNPTS